MTPDRLQKILEDTTEVDPWMEQHIFVPLLSVQEISEKKYTWKAPPKDITPAREFARQLWECCDTEDMKLLVADMPEGASQFACLGSLALIERWLKPLGKPQDFELAADKPFAALAWGLRQWLDEIGARAEENQ